MTGIYQPAVIKFLIKNDGKASLREIAKYLASIDEEIIAYYMQRLKVYPKEVLQKHGVAKIEKGSDSFEVIDGLKIEEKEKQEIEVICDDKIGNWIADNVDVERTSSGWGKIRHQMISDHRFCALCGLTPDDGVKLDIDHIIPKSKGGGNERENLQVLCHKCNRGKNNHLLNSALEAKELHRKVDSTCVFCNISKERIAFENEYFWGIWDSYPVTEFHLLVVPKRHVETTVELTQQEWAFLHESFSQGRSIVSSKDKSVEGYNVGFNVGESAGQTVMHAHFHIIPRRKGDVENPRGGIRGVIPDKKLY